MKRLEIALKAIKDYYTDLKVYIEDGEIRWENDSDKGGFGIVENFDGEVAYRFSTSPEVRNIVRKAIL